MQAEASLTQFAVSSGEMVPFSLRAQNRFLRFSGGQRVPRQASLKHPEATGSQGESALAAASSVLLCVPPNPHCSSGHPSRPLGWPQPEPAVGEGTADVGEER